MQHTSAHRLGSTATGSNKHAALIVSSLAAMRLLCICDLRLAPLCHCQPVRKALMPGLMRELDNTEKQECSGE